MRVARRVSLIALVSFCPSNFFLPSFAVAQQSDQVLAERVLGPQWKQLSRRAGMIFAGTVLSAPNQTTAIQTVSTGTVTTETTTIQTTTTQAAAAAGAVAGLTPAVQLRFRVDEAIAGVERGQVLTIREWAPAWSMHRPMSMGEHLLLFLYPLSRLGLTSPVGGVRGQFRLDSTGKNVVERKGRENPAIAVRDKSAGPVLAGVVQEMVTVTQLGRAIRTAREE